MPPPYQPITGERETLRAEGVFPYCAMMQVASEDTHNNYVVCRGFDTRTKRYTDYDEDDLETKPGISVAKPYGKRGQGVYHLGEIAPAFLPLSRIGQNPGVFPSTACFGQPPNLSRFADNLTNEVTRLTDDNGKYINWMLIDTGPLFRWVVLDQNLYLCDKAAAHLIVLDDTGAWCDEALAMTVYDTFGTVAGSALAVGGAYIPSACVALVMLMSHPHDILDDFGHSTCHWAAVTFGANCCNPY